MNQAICTIYFDGQPIPAKRIFLQWTSSPYRVLTFPHICCHPALDPLETCDACRVEHENKLERGCTMRTAEGMTIASRGV